MTLAVDSYQKLSSLEDTGSTLNLAWTLDERHHLSVKLEDLLAEELNSEAESLNATFTYPVKDPYGEDFISPAVADYFNVSSNIFRLICGAGVISLLHSLARFNNTGTIYLINHTYPDFPHWANQFGAKVVSAPFGKISPRHEENIAKLKPSIVFMERPSLTGDSYSILSEFIKLCKVAADIGSIVIVDESNANYYPASYSAINVISDFSNLVVIRGFSKAFGLGGLRLSYLVASQKLFFQLRSIIPPLLASTVSLQIGKKILECGDIVAPLRKRILANKLEMETIFKKADLEEIILSSKYLPYLFLKNHCDYINANIENYGIIGKLQPMWINLGNGNQEIYRFSTPLDITRMNKFRQKFEQ